VDRIFSQVCENYTFLLSWNFVFSHKPCTSSLSEDKLRLFHCPSIFVYMVFQIIYWRFRFWLVLILSQVPRKFTSKVEGKMGYEDFVYFILSEEDKSSEPSLEYWYLFPIIGFICQFLFLKVVIRLVVMQIAIVKDCLM
jgi:hypothetical protein